jgi:hypothetical protein
MFMFVHVIGKGYYLQFVFCHKMDNFHSLWIVTRWSSKLLSMQLELQPN